MFIMNIWFGVHADHNGEAGGGPVGRVMLNFLAESVHVPLEHLLRERCTSPLRTPDAPPGARKAVVARPQVFMFNVNISHPAGDMEIVCAHAPSQPLYREGPKHKKA